MLGGVGLTSFLLGALGLTWLAITWVVRQFDPDMFQPLHQRALSHYTPWPPCCSAHRCSQWDSSPNC